MSRWAWRLVPHCCQLSYGMLGHVRLSETLWIIARQALLSMDFPSKNTGVDCDAFLQGSSSLGLNPRLLHYRWTFYHWATGEALWRAEVKGLAGSIMKDQDSFECWPDRGGRICFALENPRLIKFYEQGKANERHLRRAEDSRWVTPAARRPAPLVGAVNLITFHRPSMAAWLGDRAYATWHVESRAHSHPPPSTFSSCCPTLTPSASTASSDMTRQIFWAVAIASWALGVRLLAALVLGCINLVF